MVRIQYALRSFYHFCSKCTHRLPFFVMIAIITSSIQTMIGTLVWSYVLLSSLSPSLVDDVEIMNLSGKNHRHYIDDEIFWIWRLYYMAFPPKSRNFGRKRNDGYIIYNQYTTKRIWQRPVGIGKTYTMCLNRHSVATGITTVLLILQIIVSL